MNLYPLIGSLVAFLFFNWNPAKIFMGDVGSTFLGAIFAGLVFNSNKLFEIFEFILFGSPLLFDAFTCVLRRFFNRQNIFSAHRQHLYQRLHQAGWSHGKVSFVYILSTFVICLSKVLFGLKVAFCSMFVIILLGFYLDRYIAISFKYLVDEKNK